VVKNTTLKVILPLLLRSPQENFSGMAKILGQKENRDHQSKISATTLGMVKRKPKTFSIEDKALLTAIYQLLRQKGCLDSASELSKEAQLIKKPLNPAELSIVWGRLHTQTLRNAREASSSSESESESDSDSESESESDRPTKKSSEPVKLNTQHEA
jgi:hypothetical protein